MSIFHFLFKIIQKKEKIFLKFNFLSSHKMSPNNVFEDTDFAAIIEKASDKEPLFIYNDKETVIDGTLDPQTGIYEIHSSGNS